MLPSLYNTEITEKRAIAYCKRHHCYITTTQVKQKDCLKKQCYHLEKKDHEFWRQRELTKARRKAKRS